MATQFNYTAKLLGEDETLQRLDRCINMAVFDTDDIYEVLKEGGVDQDKIDEVRATHYWEEEGAQYHLALLAFLLPVDDFMEKANMVWREFIDGSSYDKTTGILEIYYRTPDGNPDFFNALRDDLESGITKVIIECDEEDEDDWEEDDDYEDGEEYSTAPPTPASNQYKPDPNSIGYVNNDAVHTLPESSNDVIDYFDGSSTSSPTLNAISFDNPNLTTPLTNVPISNSTTQTTTTINTNIDRDVNEMLMVNKVEAVKGKLLSEVYRLEDAINEYRSAYNNTLTESESEVIVTLLRSTKEVIVDR